MVLRKKEFESNWMRWVEHVARMKQDAILTQKLKGEKITWETKTKKGGWY